MQLAHVRRCVWCTQEAEVASTSGSHHGRELGETIRSDFPILQQRVHGDKQLLYFDNGATSQMPRQVQEVLTEYHNGYNSNVHRGVHYMAAKVRDALLKSCLHGPVREVLLTCTYCLLRHIAVHHRQPVDMRRLGGKWRS